MVFTKRLREGIRRGRIWCSIRTWTRLKVKVGGRYPLDDGSVVVDSITPMKLREITRDLAQESGFDSVKDLLGVAKHGRGRNVYLIRFHYCRPARGTPRRPKSTRSNGPGDERGINHSTAIEWGRLGGVRT